jgi:hypothetical protein
MSKFSNEVVAMLDDAKQPEKNIAAYNMKCVRIVERLQMELEQERRDHHGLPTVQGTSTRFGPGIWNQRFSKYDSACSGCGIMIERGTKCWITVGESPRCLDCGKPEVQS